jgi:hypothetical protein
MIQGFEGDISSPDIAVEPPAATVSTYFLISTGRLTGEPW